VDTDKDGAVEMNSKKIFAGFFILSIIISLSIVSGITKQQTENVLRVELKKYLDDKENILNINDLRGLIAFHVSMPATGEVSLDSSGLSEQVKTMLLLSISNGNANNNNNGIVGPEVPLLKGRPNGAWCERDDVCGSRNCSDNWNVCSPNSNLNANTLKAYDETCSINEECKTGRCFGGSSKICKAKPCTRNDQCESGSCLSYPSSGIWGISYNSLTSSYSWYENKDMKVISFGSCNWHDGAIGY